MLVRPSARGSLSAPRVNSLRRPQLFSPCASLRSRLPASSHRLLVTRPDLLPRRRRGSGGLSHGALHERSLATAMDDARIQDGLNLGPPSMYTQPPTSSRKSAPYDLRLPDPKQPLLLRAVDSEALPRAKTNGHGVPGDVESMLSVFDACLHVGHLDRAALVLKRFDSMGCLPGSSMVKLHNRYLRANLQSHYSQPDTKWAESMQIWYETRIRARGLPQTPETVALMLKVSLLSAQDQDKLERRVHRYMGMVPGDAGLQVYSEADILSDKDLAQITSICTTHNFSPEDWVPDSEEAPQPPQENPIAWSDTKSASTGTESRPEVVPVPQKGLGLKTLRHVLSFFSDVQDRDISRLPIAEQREIQARLERDCVQAAINRWREEHETLMKMGRNTSLSTHALNSQLYDWQCSLEKKLKDEMALMDISLKREDKSAEDFDRCLLAPYLHQIGPTRLSAVAILSLLNATATAGADSGPFLSQAVNSLGKAIEEDARLQRTQTKKPKQGRKRVLKTQQRSGVQNKPSDAAVSDPHADGLVVMAPGSEDPKPSNIVDAPTYDVTAWPVVIRTKVAAFVLLSLIDTAKVTVVREHPETKELTRQAQPAFAKTSIFKKGKKIGMIMPNKYLVELMKREPRGDFLARHLPMLVEPEPWSKFDKGGFLESPSSLIRVKNGEKDQKIYTEAALKRGDLDQVCKGLDVLGRTAWRINRPVFDVMLEAWNSGEAINNFPPLNPDIPLPPEPEATGDPLERRRWMQAVRAVENEKSGLHSERCFINFQMEIANAFKDQTFYFPHNMDFRGRAYPLPTYLNHMGADNARGLLRFAEGKELGEAGFHWLKVQLANVFGFDKASLSERAAFTAENYENIKDSATNPLNGQRWWCKAEDPWQCLAACFEVYAAMQLEDPTKYVSHLPVHQDGTCNGLQHYAALGGDMWGAQQVNLEPGDRPADVYSAVANLVKESIADDAKADVLLGKIMDGKITRKVVKQTVMTNVYGVTFVGARAQVQKQIEAAYPRIRAETGCSSMLLASYVATKIFKALSTMFRGAHDIQYWLGECAGRVCRALTPEQLDRLEAEPLDVKKTPTGRVKKNQLSSSDLLGSFKSTIVWTTPLRLPVVQPYRRSGVRTIATALQDLNLVIPDRSDPVNRRKQLQAFPPNFIHSLDATHMLLSALESHHVGLTFAAVHDSFWTHAADVDTMNRVLRDSFIRIHSEDVIQRLASEFEARYKGSLYYARLEGGSEIEKAILAHRAQSRLAMPEELLQERERLRLLQSADPADVERGRQMTTPASIFEEHAAAQASVVEDEMSEVGLGNMPPGTEIGKSGPDGPKAYKGAEDWIKGKAHDPEYVKEFLATTGFEQAIKKQPTPKVNKSKFTGVWIPLSFPKLPEKGEFDVKRLKGSQYFFS
ncbi:uncharacterized protein JN550_001184 [Neoarthrinium moseri]|uniref:uncharacterized protein n=1 Tax=Neoarthrinium moseri TaxID=1658444 RepID=UPI001FDC1926|nr:uncharacterized protein JN550_001184 [Neoarthrinium moseri]KAI1877112.1 hypothetical protein JN550_001184 [Neoarthrinium moseri]